MKDGNGGMLTGLSTNSVRVLTYERLLGRVWGGNSYGDVRPMSTIVNKLRCKLGEDAGNPTYAPCRPPDAGEGESGTASLTDVH